MNSPVILRTTILVLVLTFLLAACGKDSKAIVDMSPVGDAVRFLAVAVVLAVIIHGVLRIWNKE